MDAQIGRVLDGLEKSGKAGNTWIFFSADHGLAVGHHGLMGKQNLYDPSVQVPFIVAGHGVPEGKTISDPIFYQDIMPSTLALAGSVIPDHVAFQNLLPIIRGQGKTKYDAIFGSYMDLQRSITKDRWKLIVHPKIKEKFLFDLAADPQEMTDLSIDPKHSPKLKYFFDVLCDLQRVNGDPLDLSADYPWEAGDCYPGSCE